MNESIRVFSLTDKLSKYTLLAGKLPEKAGDIALDQSLKSVYDLGSKVELVNQDGKAIHSMLNRSAFTVVGYVESSEFVSKTNLGSSTVGTGSLDTYGVVTEDHFDSDVYTMARIKVKGASNYAYYEDAYTRLINKSTAHITSSPSLNGVLLLSKRMDKRILIRPKRRSMTPSGNWPIRSKN